MEGGVVKPEVPDISKSTRSLELKSIYGETSRGSVEKSRGDSQESKDLKRKHGLSFDSGGGTGSEPRRKRSRKLFSLNSLDPGIRRRHNGSSRLNSIGFVSGIGKKKKLSSSSGLGDNVHNSGTALTLPLAKKEGRRAFCVGSLEIPNCLDDTITIPKRPRDMLRRKRSDNSVYSNKTSGTSACISNGHVDDQTSNLSLDQVPLSRSLTVKHNEDANVVKEIGSIGDNSKYSTKDANHSPGKVSRRKMQSRKLQVSTIETQTHGDTVGCLDKNVLKPSKVHLDDDEENLEHNAARMLSSRFDTRCTGFLGDRMKSSKPVDGSSSLLLREGSKGLLSDVSSVYSESRALRPRKFNGKGFVRKRRHFYEVHYSDMDPFWVIKQRIRVFWPSDQNWYFGMVKDYDPITKLHNVKYDDRDEEWVNLQTERFKLLLFPSEVKFNRERSQQKVTKENEKKDASSAENIEESETIISWLTRSAQQLKSSPAWIQKHRRNHLLKGFEPSTLSAPEGHMYQNPSSATSSKFSSSCNVEVTLIDRHITEEHIMQTKADHDNRRLPYVYFRKRFRSREGLAEKPEGGSAFVCSDGPISLLASVADRESTLEELSFNVLPTELKRITLMLCPPILRFHQHAYGAEHSVLLRTINLYQRKLIRIRGLWTVIHMEIIVVDDALGLKVFSFEGSLRLAVALICLIMATFYRNKNCNQFPVRQATYTSIGFKLSDLPDRELQFFFALCSFVELERPKWRYLEEKLRQHCMLRKDLSVANCTYVNIKNLSNRSDQSLFASFLEDTVSSECFPRSSCSNIVRPLVPIKSAHLNIDSGSYYFDEKYGMLPPCDLSSPAAPLFSISLHLKLLMENNASAISFANSNSTLLMNDIKNPGTCTGEGSSHVEDYTDQVCEITNEKFGPSFSQAAVSSGRLNHLEVKPCALFASNNGHQVRSSHCFLNSEVNLNGSSVAHCNMGKNVSDETVARPCRFSCPTKSCRSAKKSCPSFQNHSSYPEKIDIGCSYSLNTTKVQTHQFSQSEEQLSDRGRQASHCSTSLISEMNECGVRSPNTTAPRSTWHRNRHSSDSPIFGQWSTKLWQDDYVQNRFFLASKKPRTQVSYVLPAGDGDLYRSHHKKGRLYKEVKTDNVKRISGGLERPESYLGSLICYANVLITVGDKGWRECGAQVVLDSDDQKDWSILVKLCGITKYVHKAHQFLQPGATNRYTHAIMWKGGNDWSLEFSDRSQWSIFKVMHEECFNRNVRSACVKNIPIPGVRHVDDGDDNIIEMPFIRSSSKYYRQVATEVEMALDSSYVLYDMDSGDEEWVSNLKTNTDMAELTDDMFERAMDMFEKVAYAKHHERFTNDEIEEFMADFGPPDIIKAIHEHWWQKRQKKTLPLIRQFQPALWEHYMQQVKEWELAMSKAHSSSDGCQDKACFLEKPAMFAFCLRPRGLEAPNKGSKQKSHRKLMFTGYHNSSTREQDGFHANGRKVSRLPNGEEKSSFTVPNHELSSQLLQYSSSSDGSDRSYYAKIYRNNSKSNRMFLSPSNSLKSPKFTHNETSKRNGAHRSGYDMCDWPSKTKHLQSDGFRRPQADINEFRLRDASSAAQHATNMAKLKREKAQWLFHKADLALQKATAALLTAEAMKASQKDLDGDG